MTCWLSPRLRRTLLTLGLGPVLVLSTSRMSLGPAAGSSAMAQAPAAKDAPRDEAAKKDAPKSEPRKDEAAKEEPVKPKARPVTVQEPVAGRVYQRGEDDRADIPIVLSEGAPPEMLISASIQGQTLQGGVGTYRDGKLVGVPIGGPYQITVALKSDKSEGRFAGGAVQAVTIAPVYVGDLWVLAGQSNMEGVGNLQDVTPPLGRVQLLGMDGRWGRAEEPLHWLVDSPDPVHSGNPSDREARSSKQHKTRTKGAGLGLAFGVVMASTTNIPVGLIACAHGGTSMQQWDPAKKGDGGHSLYGSMLRQIGLAGGKVRGILWYQGESDAMTGAAKDYPRAFADFIAAVRDDLGQPDLPFYLVQIGRFVNPADPKGWNAVQEAQRLIPDRVPNTAVVASIDLELDDLIHVGTQGLKRLGTRLARIALRELHGQVGATTPTFDRVARRGNDALVVRFKGVNRAAAEPRPDQLAGLAAGINLNAPSYAPAAGQPLQGLRPSRHIAGFSIRKADGTEIPLIYDAAVGQARDSVVLKLAGKVPDGARLWYGYGLDPQCNLTDALDMAVPVFGPIPLDDVK